MSEDIDYTVRPREMRGERSKWTRDEKHRRAAHDRDRARSANRKLIHRGLNRDTTGPALSRAIGEACAPLDRNSYEAMRRLTLALEAMGSDLVSVGGGPQALARLARFHRAWIRTPRTWAMITPSDTGESIASLARHLICTYDVPKHLAQCWMTDASPNVVARDWYVRLGSGQSLRGANGFPFAMSRAMSHHFVQALSRFAIAPALRYAQFRALGVSDEISTIIALSALGQTRNRETTCVELAQFFARFPTIEPANVRPIIDYLLAQRRRVTLAGRTPATVMRLVEGWHRQLYLASIRPHEVELTWDPCGIAGHAQSVETADGVIDWEIVELLSSVDLRGERAAMHHCVASYASQAAKGHCAIFSLRRRAGAAITFTRAVTIDVDLKARAIAQARRACNAMPTPQELRIIRDWARIERLELRDLRLL
jgi:hypothetical protein